VCRLVQSGASDPHAALSVSRWDSVEPGHAFPLVASMATPRGSIFERLRFPRPGEGMRPLFELPDLQAQRRLLDAESLGGSRVDAKGAGS
jgi:hypothetical protein